MNKCITCDFSLGLCLHNSTKRVLSGKMETMICCLYDTQMFFLTTKCNLVFPDPYQLEGRGGDKDSE